MFHMNFYAYLINNPNLSLNIYFKLLFFAINYMSFLFCNIQKIFNPAFKSSFWYTVTIWISVYRLRIQNSYRVVKNRYQMWILKICDEKIYISDYCLGFVSSQITVQVFRDSSFFFLLGGGLVQVQEPRDYWCQGGGGVHPSLPPLATSQTKILKPKILNHSNTQIKQN